MNLVRELAPEAWTEYLDALTREMINSPVSIEVVAAAPEPTQGGRRLALQGLAYNDREHVFEVAAAGEGARVSRVLRHLVQRPTRIQVDNDTMLAPMTIAVDGEDGGRTVITIERKPDRFD